MNSKDIHAEYHGNLRDVHVYELEDATGIQVVRKYPASEKCLGDYRMFMRLYLKKEYGIVYIVGGVDMVKAADDARLNWIVVSDDGRVYEKPTNYSFWTNEQIRFNEVSKKVLFCGNSITITECIDQMEKNHLRDMFVASRTANALTTFSLHILFFLGGLKYDWSKLLLTNHGGSRDRRGDEVPLAIVEQDPYFHHFAINKNLFAVGLALSLYPLYIWSHTLPHEFFTIENPFIIVSFLLCFFVLSVLSDVLQKFLATKYIKSLAMATLQARGKLRMYRN